MQVLVELGVQTKNGGHYRKLVLLHRHVAFEDAKKRLEPVQAQSAERLALARVCGDPHALRAVAQRVAELLEPAPGQGEGLG